MESVTRKVLEILKEAVHQSQWDSKKGIGQRCFLQDSPTPDTQQK